MSVEFSVELGDVTKIASDLLILKYAQNFYGADGDVADILAENAESVPSPICNPNPERRWRSQRAARLRRRT